MTPQIIDGSDSPFLFGRLTSVSWVPGHVDWSQAHIFADRPCTDDSLWSDRVNFTYFTPLHCATHHWGHGFLMSWHTYFFLRDFCCNMYNLHYVYIYIYIYIYTYTHISFESSFAMPFQVWLCTKLSLIVCHACPLIRHWAFARTISLRHFQRISDVCLRQRETGTEGTEKPLGRCQEMQNIAASKSNEK